MLLGGRPQGVRQGLAPGPPVREQPLRRLRGPLPRAVVDEVPGRGERLLDLAGERVLVGHGQRGGVVGPGEVRDLVGDGPAGGGVGSVHRSGLNSATSRSSSSLSARRSSSTGVGSAMGWSMAAGQETIKHACMNFPGAPAGPETEPTFDEIEDHLGAVGPGFARAGGRPLRAGRRTYGSRGPEDVRQEPWAGPMAGAETPRRTRHLPHRTRHRAAWPLGSPPVGRTAGRRQGPHRARHLAP